MKDFKKLPLVLNDLYLKNGKFPGFVSAVARKGKVVHYETIGFADLETGESLKKDSLFRIYSMSKPITGVALMILLEEGKLRLNDPVSLYTSLNLLNDSSLDESTKMALVSFRGSNKSHDHKGSCNSYLWNCL